MEITRRHNRIPEVIAKDARTISQNSARESIQKIKRYGKYIRIRKYPE